MSNQKDNIISIFGWYGVVSLLFSYYLISFNFVSSSSIFYQFLNISGSVGIATEALYKKDNPAMVLNIVWAVIGLVALYNIFYR